jgi:curved DNA-binding protein CbpA
MGNDYYKTLGVAPNAEDVVIRAAHKALIQHYNLDGWKGDKLEANRKLFELNEALVVLTDSVKREVYDDALGTESHPAESQLIKAELSVDQISKDWQVACQFNPDLSEISNELSALSVELSYAFKIALLESRQFDECYLVAKKIEQEYLQNLFGKNENIQRFGNELLREGLSDAAIELSDIVRVMGESIDAPDVIDAISKKHQPQKWIDIENKQKLIILESQAALEKSQKLFSEREKKMIELKEIQKKQEAEATKYYVNVVLCLSVLVGLAAFFFKK